MKFLVLATAIFVIACQPIEYPQEKVYDSLYGFTFQNEDLSQLESTNKLGWNGDDRLITISEKKVFPTADSTYKIIGKVLKVRDMLKDSLFVCHTLDTILTDGGEPKVHDIFLANGDDDLAAELFIIIRRNIKTREVFGQFYDVLIYEDNLRGDKTFNFKNTELDSILNVGCNCTWNQDIIIDSRDKVIAILENLKYPQYQVGY